MMDMIDKSVALAVSVIIFFLGASLGGLGMLLLAIKYFRKWGEEEDGKK